MTFVAAAATLPPELFDSILFYVCEFAVDLLDPEAITPSRKQTIKDITACSLTCVYWARICRERIFKKIWIKNYEDLCTFSSLTSSTPKSFKPISALAQRATLVLHIADRPWLHLLRLQPSMVPEMPLVRNYASIHFHIIDSSSTDSDTPRRPTYRCVFSGLPRALPASCHQCDDLTIRNPYFRTERDVKSLLAKFGRRPYPRKHIVAWNVTLLDVTWDTVKADSTPLNDLLIKGDNLELKFAGISASVTVEGNLHTAETAWLAYSVMMRYHLQSSIPVLLNSRIIDTPLQLLPSAQQDILDIVKPLCPNHKTSKLLIYQYMWDPLLHKNAYMRRICSIKNGGFMSPYPFVIFGFYAAQSTTDLLETDHPVIVDHISALCVSIECGSGEQSHPEEGAVSGVQTIAALPWEELVEICAAQNRFNQLQLQFSHRDHLVEFMDVRRAAFTKLDGRIRLFHRTGRLSNYDWCFVDYESLAELGDARQHGYSW